MKLITVLKILTVIFCGTCRFGFEIVLPTTLMMLHTNSQTITIFIVMVVYECVSIVVVHTKWITNRK